jgi:hypothetical protein
MKFYEFIEPYYALIKARDEEEATKYYIEIVAGEDEEFKEILEECELVSDYYAVAKFAQSKGENGEMMKIDEILEVLESDEPELLLIDGSLI